MEEAVMYGVAVAMLMLGVPLWHSMGECRKGRLVRVHLCRWWLLCGFMVMLSLMIGILFGVAGFALQNYSSAPKAARFSADCRIVAKGVDIRSAKVCEDGNLAHLQKSRQNSIAPSKFRCSWDYYWSSVFKVEYMPRTSTSAVLANAELPSGTISSTCRPSFASAWRTKETFEVNGTYPCTYNSKNLKIVDITVDKGGNCSTENEQSNLDLMKQFWYLLVHAQNALLSASAKTGELFSRAAAAVGLGICYSMIVTGFTRAVCQVHFHFEHGEYTDLDVVYFEARIQLAILFTASVFGVIWLSNNFFSDDIDTNFFSRALYKSTGFVE
ncbi:unnamed protein product [Calypogeia fissa]